MTVLDLIREQSGTLRVYQPCSSGGGRKIGSPRGTRGLLLVRRGTSSRLRSDGVWDYRSSSGHRGSGLWSEVGVLLHFIADLIDCHGSSFDQVSARVAGVSLGSFGLGDLGYAGDAALFSSTLEDISQALPVFDEEATKLGLQFIWDKTELMLVGYGTEPQPLTFDGFQVRFVSKFRYLGSTIASNGGLRPEIAR